MNECLIIIFHSYKLATHLSQWWTGQLDTGLTHAEDEAAAGRASRHEPLLVVHLAEQEAAVLLEHLPQDNPPSQGDLTCRCSPWCPSA